jgi:hypothetical protein
MLFIVDGIWGGDLPVCEPVKWQIDPFNNDWPNSIFVSQDHVAIESVGMDFVKAQFDEYADMEGADDYLHQTADSAYWADGIVYDPDGDGILIHSLGVHEHWNNDIDKEYTRNLGIGDGIELIKYLITGLDEGETVLPAAVMAYPNPFSDNITLTYRLSSAASVILSIYDLSGKRIDHAETYHATAGDHQISRALTQLPRGVYTYNLYISGTAKDQSFRGKIIKQ